MNAEAPELFTPAWAEAFCHALNANERYRQAARNWEGALLLIIEASPRHGIPTSRAVHLDLYHGTCRSAWAGTPEEAPEAAYVLSATPEVWKEILSGKRSPMAAMLQSRLKLRKGKLAALFPYVRAAQELVATAARLKTRFPPGW